MMRGEQKELSGNLKCSDEESRTGKVRKRAGGVRGEMPIGWCENPSLYMKLFPRIQWEKLVPKEDAGVAVRTEMQNPKTRLSIAPVRYRDIPALVREGWIRPLDEYFPKEYLAGFAAPALELSRMNGKLYAIPDDITPFVYFVNRDVLDRIGGPLPGTWGEAESFAVRAAKLGYHAFGLPSLGVPFREGFLLSLFGSNGVDLKNGMAGLLEAPERLLEGYEWLRKLIYSLKLLPRDVFISGDETNRSRNDRLGAASGFAWMSAFERLTAEEMGRLALLPFPRGPSANSVCQVPLKGRAWCMPWSPMAPREGFHVLRNIHTPRSRRVLNAEAFPFLAWKECWDNPQLHRKHPLYEYAGKFINDKTMVFSHGECSLEVRLSVTIRGALLDRTHGGEWVKRLGSSPTPTQGAGGMSLPALLQKVESSLSNINGVRGIARELGISVQSLRRLFLGAMKEDIGGYIRKRRMNAAHDLLLNRQISVKEVAPQVGYANVSAFCRAYRKFWGHATHEDRLNPLNIAGTGTKTDSRG